MLVGFISEFPVKTEVFVNRSGELQYSTRSLLHDLILYYLKDILAPSNVILLS